MKKVVLVITALFLAIMLIACTPVAEGNELAALIEQYQQLKAEDYTAESWESFSSSVSAALEVLGNENAAKEQIEEAETNLTDAFNSLVTLESLADSFKADQVAILAVSVDNVTLSDKAAVQNALESFNKLANEVKAKLTIEKALLDSLLDKIAGLEVLQASLIKAKAEKLAKVPSLEDFTKADYTAASWEDFQAAIASDISAINALTSIEEVEAYSIKANSSILITISSAVEAFKSTYAQVLGMTAENITLSDKAAVQNALDAYNSLSDEVSVHLTAERGLLTGLLNKIAELETLAVLTAAKAEKLAKVPSLNDFTKATYTAASWTEFQAAITADIDAINTLTSIEEVEAYLIKANSAVLVTIASVVEAFRNAYANTLSMSAGNVTLADKTAILTALNAYYSLADEIAAQLTAEKAVLTTLNNEIILIENSITLTFETNGGDLLAPTVVQRNSSASLPSAVRTGYTFIGWYLESNFLTEISGVAPSVSSTLHARWIQGNVVVVSEGGNIQTAVNNASSGGTVFVKPGVYVGYITISKSLTFLGNNFDIRADQVRRSETVLYPADNSDFNSVTGRAIITANYPYTTIAGFYVDGNNPLLQNIWTAEKNNAAQALIDTSSKSRIEAKNLYTSLVNREIGFDCATGISIYPVGVTHMNETFVLNNICKNFIYAALDCTYNSIIITTTGSKIEGNLFANVRGFGMFYNGAYYGVYGQAMQASKFAALFQNNTFENNQIGVQFSNLYEAGQTTLFTNNTFRNNSVDLWINSTGLADKVEVIGNNFIRNGNYLNILGMHSYNSSAIIISATGAGSLLIADNTIANYGTGILVNNTRIDTVFVYGNRISGCDTAIAIRRDFLTYLNNDRATYLVVGPDNTLTDNIQDFEVESTTANCFMLTFVDTLGAVVDTQYVGKLATPNAALNASTKIRWAKIANATGYILTINGNDFSAGIYENGNYMYYDLDLTSLVPESVYTLAIIATDGDDANRLENSDAKTLELVRITLSETLTAPATTFASKTVYVLKDSLLSAITTKARSGYELSGWYDDASFNNAVTPENLALAESGTFYADWQKTIVYNFYGLDNAAIVYTVTLRYNQPLSATEGIAVDGFVISGYSFVGWYSNTARTAAYVFGNPAAAATVKIYGKFTVNP